MMFRLILLCLMVLLGDAFFLDEATKATSLHTAPKERVGRTQTTATELPVHHLDYAFGRKVLFRYAIGSI